MPVEIQPVHREIGVIGLKGLRGVVVAVRVCVLGWVPEDAVVGFVDEEAGGEVDAGDCVVVVAADGVCQETDYRMLSRADLPRAGIHCVCAIARIAQWSFVSLLGGIVC